MVRLSLRAVRRLSFLSLLALCPTVVAQVAADPLEGKTEISPDAIKAIDLQGNGEVVYADAYGPFLMFGSNKTPKDARRLISLKDGKVVYTIAGKYDIDRPTALAPSGKYFAAWRGFFVANNIAVFDAKGKPYAELKNSGKVEDLRFLADDRLAATSGDLVSVWDLRTKKVVATIALPKHGPFGPRPLVSPNGKVIFSFDGPEVRAYDSGGKELAKYSAPKMEERFGSEVKGISLHPDGKTLALFLHSIRKSGIALLDTGDATFKGPFEIEEAKGFIGREEKPIEWSAKGDALLVRGKLVVDPESGKVLWNLPDPPKNGGSSGRLFSVGMGIGVVDGGGSSLALKGSAQDEDKLEDLVKAARSGVKVSDALLPKLTEVTLTGVPTAEAPTKVANWTAKPDTASAGKLPTAPLKLDVKANLIEKAEIVGGKLFVDIKQDGGPRFGPRAQGVRTKAVDIYDLATGLRAGRVDLGFAAKFHSASPDGKLIALVDPDNGERVDVLAVEKGEPVAAFRPFFQEGAARKVTVARFVGSSKLLTGNGSRFVVWSLPDCKADVQAPTRAGLPELSPNGKLLALASDDGVRLFDATTLAAVGDLSLPTGVKGTREAKAIAFSADGKSLAAVYQGAAKGRLNATQVVSWDLVSGKQAVTATVSGSSGSPFGQQDIEFVGNDHFLVNGTLLVDGKRNEVVWTFPAGFDVRHLNSPDGRQWYTTRGEIGSDLAVLASADILQSKIPEWVKTIDSAPTALWKAGSAVNVSVQIGDQQDKAQKTLEESLSQQGMKVDSSAPATLTVTASERPTGQTIKYRDLSPSFKDRGGDQTLNIVETTGVAQLNVKGTVIWEGKTVISNRGSSFLSLPQGETVDSYLTKQMKNSIAGWAGHATPPRTIVQTKDGNLALPGTASFTSKGLEVQPPVIRLPK